MWNLGMNAGDCEFKKVDGQDVSCRIVPDI